MLKKTVLILFIFLSLQIVNANDFVLKDINTKELITNVYVEIKLTSGNSIREYIGDRGVLTVEEQAFSIKVDNINTNGKDYYLDTISRNELFLLPVGTIQGIVVDKSNNVVPNANVNIECGSTYGTLGLTKTNKFGAFSYDYVPIGLCKIFAAYQDGVGYKTILVEHGKISDTTIMLDSNIISSNNELWIIILIVLILIIIYFLFKRFKSKIKIKKIIKKDTKKISQRTTDVLATLKDKEKIIVNFLLENNNEGTQARIKHHTNIPKTSLSRIFESLKSKNVIEIEKMGKMKKIKLTSWFLDK